MFLNWSLWGGCCMGRGQTRMSLGLSAGEGSRACGWRCVCGQELLQGWWVPSSAPRATMEDGWGPIFYSKLASCTEKLGHWDPKSSPSLPAKGTARG